MTDNIFERLFELFNQPGSVNWALAEELSASLAGEAQPIDPWIADEYLELGSVALLQTDSIDILPSLSGETIDPVDRSVWAKDNLRSFDYLAESLGGGMGASAGPLQPLVSAMVGMQVGTLVGTLSHHALGGFDVGLLAIAPRGYLIVHSIEAFTRSHEVDAKQVRLWAALHEAMHLRISRHTWLGERYSELLRSWLEGIEFDAQGLIGNLQGMTDPSAMQEAMEGFGDLPALLGDSANQGDRDNAIAILALLGGLRRHLMEDFRSWLPDLDRIRLGLERRDEEPDAHSAMAIALPDHDQVVRAAAFCAEVEERWGRETLGRVIATPGTLPTAVELGDPVGWAARVLLDDGAFDLD
jgi:putative hydrolase